MPSRRKCSIERALVLLHFGCCAVVRFSVTSTQGTPRQLSSIAADKPTGPPPTINAKVSVCIGWQFHKKSTCRHCPRRRAIQ
jgi:hypothetical protein